MIKALRKLGRVVTGQQWEVVRTIWPYPDGWGVWNSATHTAVETGIPKEQAQSICDVMNGEAEEAAAEPDTNYVNQ